MDTKQTCGAIAALFALVAVSPAQEGKTAEMTMEEREASVKNLQAHIDQRRERLREVADEITSLDGRIEKRVDKAVGILADMRDSQDSKRRVSQMKKDAIEGLKQGLQLYASQRRELAEMAKTGDEAALDDLPVITDRIGKRMEQIVTLSKSFPTGEDVRKYEPDGGSYWNGYFHETSRVSNEWKQNRRDASQSKVVREQTSKELRNALERLKSRRAILVDNLENRNPSPAAKELYLQEIGQIDAFETKLNGELNALTLSDGQGAFSTPSLNEVIGIERRLDDIRADLREDVSEMFRLYGAFIKERNKVQKLEENLKAREDWLEKNAPKE